MFWIETGDRSTRFRTRNSLVKDSSWRWSQHRFPTTQTTKCKRTVSVRNLNLSSIRALGSIWFTYSLDFGHFGLFLVQWMSKYSTGFVFRQLALVPLPYSSSDFRRCLKSELENPKLNVVYSYKSIWTGCVQFKLPKSSLKSEFPSDPFSA